MKTIQTLSQSLHQLQASAMSEWGEDSHNACVENGEAVECSNCGGTWPKAKYCWQHHLQRLVISNNGPQYLKDNS